MPRWLSIKGNHAPCRAFNLSIKISVEGGVFIFVKKGKRWTAIYHNYQEREGTNLAQGKEKKTLQQAMLPLRPCPRNSTSLLSKGEYDQNLWDHKRDWQTTPPSCSTSNTKDLWNTEKRVENETHSGVFVKNFEAIGSMFKHLLESSWVLSTSRQSKLKLRKKIEN